MDNTALDNSNNSKFSKVKGEFKRFFSIFVLPTEGESDDSFEAIKANTNNANDISIIEELERSQNELEKDAINFFEGNSKGKKENSRRDNNSIKVNSKPSIGKITKIEPKGKGFER